MVRLVITNLPSPAPPYLLEVKEINGGISWDRRNGVEPVLLHISLNGLSGSDITRLSDACRTLGCFRKVSVELAPTESPDEVVTFQGFIKSLVPRQSNSVTLQMEEAR